MPRRQRRAPRRGISTSRRIATGLALHGSRPTAGIACGSLFRRAIRARASSSRITIFTSPSPQATNLFPFSACRIRMRQALNGNKFVAWGDGDVKIVILEEEALARIARRKSEPQAIPAVGLDPCRAKPVAIRLDVDIPRL